MCLQVDLEKHRFHRPKITLFPKKCYKILLLTNKRIETPFTYTVINNNVIKNGMYVDDNFQKQPIGYFYPSIYNAIHAFCQLNDAVHELHNIEPYTYHDQLYRHHIVETFIPPFTRYWYGVAGDICSERMCFTRKSKKKLLSYLNFISKL